MRALVGLLFLACSAPVAGANDTSTDGAVAIADAAPSAPVAFSINLAAPDVAPGAEGLHCIDVPGPAADTYVSGWRVRRTGVHHVNAHVRTSGTPVTAWGPCVDVFAHSTFLFDASSDLDESLPPGDAVLIPGGSSLVFDEHYVNAGTAPIREHTAIDFLEANSHATLLHALNLAQSGDLNLQPGETKTVSFAAAPQIRIQIISMMGHMHAHGASETASVGGHEVYRTDSWSEPALVHPADLFVGPGAPLTWSCTCSNPDSYVVQWGTTVARKEMCQVFGLVTGGYWGATGQGL